MTPRSPHAQLHLPPLSADQALLLLNLLDRVIAALWRAHGDAIAERLCRIDDPDPAPAPRPDDELF